MFSRLGAPEIILIVIVVLLLFGAGAAKKLPGAAKSLGQSLRIFKAEMKQMREDDHSEAASRTTRQDGDSDEPGAHVPRPLPSSQRAAEEVRRDRVADR